MLLITKNIAVQSFQIVYMFVLRAEKVIILLESLSRRRVCQYRRQLEVNRVVIDANDGVSPSRLKSRTWKLIDCRCWFKTRTADTIIRHL